MEHTGIPLVHLARSALPICELGSIDRSQDPRTTDPVRASGEHLFLWHADAIGWRHVRRHKGEGEGRRSRELEEFLEIVADGDSDQLHIRPAAVSECIWELVRHCLADIFVMGQPTSGGWRGFHHEEKPARGCLIVPMRAV